jgi:hypothetical protein
VETSRISGRNIKTERRGESSGKFEINSDKIVFRRCELRETDRKFLPYNCKLYKLKYYKEDRNKIEIIETRQVERNIRRK